MRGAVLARFPKPILQFSVQPRPFIQCGLTAAGEVTSGCALRAWLIRGPHMTKTIELQRGGGVR